jgi:glutathione-regulated potassium-efflux system ancillary protein KefC
VAAYLWGPESFGADKEWIKFIATFGAVLLTFLAGAELEPQTMRTKIKEVGFVGSIGFLAPFIGCFLVAKYLLGWDTPASLLTGVALSTDTLIT